MLLKQSVDHIGPHIPIPVPVVFVGTTIIEEYILVSDYYNGALARRTYELEDQADTSHRVYPAFLEGRKIGANPERRGMRNGQRREPPGTSDSRLSPLNRSQ